MHCDPRRGSALAKQDLAGEVIETFDGGTDGEADDRGALVPRFRSSSYIAAPSDTNFGSNRGTSKHMILVPLFDLKFLK